MPVKEPYKDYTFDYQGSCKRPDGSTYYTPLYGDYQRAKDELDRYVAANPGCTGADVKKVYS